MAAFSKLLWPVGSAMPVKNSSGRSSFRYSLAILLTCLSCYWFLHVLQPADAGAVPSAAAEEKLVQAMIEHIDCFPLEVLDVQQGKPLISIKELCMASIYHQTGARPLWVTSEGPGVRGQAIRERLQRAAEEGLNSQDYEVDTLERLWESRRPEDLARLDTQLSYGLVRYIHDLRFGQIQLRAVDSQLFAEAGDEEFDPLRAVLEAGSSPDFDSYLDGLAPKHSYYRQLREALQHYRELAAQGDWPIMVAGPVLRPGMADARLAVLRQRLALTENYQGVVEESEVYHPDLVKTVKAFQEKHGLEPDGVIGPKTLTMLNRTPEELIKTIRVNMARWRWQAHDLGDTYLMVNIAAFSLKGIRDGQESMTLPVIVGKFQHQTPVFSSRIRYLEFHPYWTITPNIARNEELPALRKNRFHLVDRHVRLFSSWQEDAVELDSTAIDWEEVSRAQMGRYRLRQDPGPWNALGQVKFVFPNKHMVYLHDTPTQDLFHQASRSFSHGCIRVSQPLALAAFCLEGQDGWTDAAIGGIVAAGQRKVVSLRKPLPVHITYQTAWVDNNAVIRFNADIYGRDRKILEALDAHHLPH
jgi:L,D-transpeptidase YcbB